MQAANKYRKLQQPTPQRSRYWDSLVVSVLGLALVANSGLLAQELPSDKRGNPKLESHLQVLATLKPGVAAKTAGSALQTTNEGLVVVILEPAPGEKVSSLDLVRVQALGGKILAQSQHLVRVALPPHALEAITQVAGVHFVRQPMRPHAQAVYTEGAGKIGARLNQYQGIKGRGIKIGIIDNRFEDPSRYPAELPAEKWQMLNFNKEEYLNLDGGKHGTACAEIIHDIAPEAQLYLFSVSDLCALENAKDKAIEEGIDIISMSLSFPRAGFGDGQGLACQIIDDAADHGILWVSAAGNYVEKVYNSPATQWKFVDGTWRQIGMDDNQDHWVDFAAPDQRVRLINADNGHPIWIYLTWDAFPATDIDLDLHLYRQDESGQWHGVYSSMGAQQGTAPYESIYLSAVEPGEYALKVSIANAQPTNSVAIRLVSHNHNLIGANSVATVSVPGDARGALTVGAVRHINWKNGPIEPYSSQGPTQDGRIKPDLVGPTGVSTATFADRGWSFSGTSAAAPHVAGAAALVKSSFVFHRQEELSRDQLFSFLVHSTIDMGQPGPDTIYGHGKLVLADLTESAAQFQHNQLTPFDPQWANGLYYNYYLIDLYQDQSLDLSLVPENHPNPNLADIWLALYDPTTRSYLAKGARQHSDIPVAKDGRFYLVVYGRDLLSYRLEAKATPGPLALRAAAKLTASATALAPLPAPQGTGLHLAQNRPNPFNGQTTLAFTIGPDAANSHIKLVVYNLIGQQVAVLVDQSLPAGDYQQVWHGVNAAGIPLASGKYFYRLETAKSTRTKSMLYLR